MLTLTGKGVHELLRPGFSLFEYNRQTLDLKV